MTDEFKSGGATYIKITDDGCGMSPEDAGIAFTRHATSKLHDEKGLEAIDDGLSRRGACGDRSRQPH